MFFNGGDGVDTATYAGVTDPVTVTLDNVASDGTMNEQDSVETGDKERHRRLRRRLADRR